jgi:ABC-type transport system involved in cytochrome bd biosynthesis fused ATPase/permease subunit
VLGEGRTFDAPYNSSKESFKAVIEIMNGTFRWDVREKAALQDSAEAAEKKGRKSVFSAASLRASSPSGQESRPLFDGLDLRIKKGSLTAIVGPVGK